MSLRIPLEVCTDTGLPSCQLLVRAIHNVLWPLEAWGRGWTCHWVEHDDAWGYCDFDRLRIELAPDLLTDRMDILIPTVAHELTHYRLGPEVPHGKSFNALESKLAFRLGVVYKQSATGKTAPTKGGSKHE